MEVEEPTDQYRPLDGKRRYQQIERNSREAVSLEESHQEPETDEDHNVDILEHLGERKKCKNCKKNLFLLGYIFSIIFLLFSPLLPKPPPYSLLKAALGSYLVIYIEVDRTTLLEAGGLTCIYVASIQTALKYFQTI